VPVPVASSSVAPSPQATAKPLSPVKIVATFALPTTGVPSVHPIVALDGSLWYADNDRPTLYRIDSAGTVTAFLSASAAAGTQIRSLAAGPDGDIYYTLDSGGASAFEIRKIAPGGTDTLFAQPALSCVDAIVFDNDVLYGTGVVAGGAPGSAGVCHPKDTGSEAGELYRFDSAGKLETSVALPGSGLRPGQPEIGSDGRVWFFAFASGTGAAQALVAANARGTAVSFALKVSPLADRLVRGPYRSLYFPGAGGPLLDKVDTTGLESTFALQPSGAVVDVTRGSDGGIWFVGLASTGAPGTFGRRDPGLPLALYSFPKIPDAIVTGADGYYYVFAHATGSSAEDVSRVSLP
jgi:streptogramin lyase